MVDIWYATVKPISRFKLGDLNKKELKFIYFGV